MTLFEQLAALTTEAINPGTSQIDVAGTRKVVQMLNDQDKSVALAVEGELDHIAQAVDLIVDRLIRGGRLIYVGAGTSGRLGIVDASEMPPTYGTDPDMVVGIIAGGQNAVFQSVEGAEDSRDEGRQALIDLSASELDVVCGISASGRTPFVLGALEYAHTISSGTVFVSTNARSTVQQYAPEAQVLICPLVGPEPITGSTRMKSGTAQKMVLNMLTTASMVKLGKTYGNVMVDLQLTNEKLQERAKRIITTIAHVSYERAEQLLSAANGHVKTALVMASHSCSREEALERLKRANGIVRIAMESES
ncbi:MAG: N-acetylmuramic acid 6-phosphate etherase [Ignavibacteria bacterium]|jgi:N-acetylmuramic acid 6-phosphate etherase